MKSTDQTIPRHFKGVEWLKQAIAKYFDKPKINASVWQECDCGRPTLCIAIYSNFTVEEFRERRRKLSDDMLENNYTELYLYTAVYQRHDAKHKGSSKYK